MAFCRYLKYLEPMRREGYLDAEFRASRRRLWRVCGQRAWRITRPWDFATQQKIIPRSASDSRIAFRWPPLSLQ